MQQARAFVEEFRSGHYEEARTLFESLPEAQRTHPIILEIAANVYAQLGDPDGEVSQWRELGRLRPYDARVCRSLATALLDHDRLDEACAELQRFLFGQHADVEVAGLLVQVFLRRRQYGEAIEVVEEVRSLAGPDEAAALVALEARARFHLDQLTTARALLATLDREPPASVVACREIAQTWRTMRDFPQAIAWFNRAGALDPSHVETWEALASCHEQNRDPERARQIAHATAARFGSTTGMERLLVRIEHQEDQLTAARQRGEALLERSLAPSVRRSLHLELATVAQRQGDLVGAFAHARSGNELATIEFGQQGLLPGLFTESVRQIASRAHIAFGTPARPTDGRRAPVFLVGVPRAGTTLVQQMLQGHSRIETLDETDPGSRILRRHWASHPELAPAPYPEQLAQIEPGDWPGLRDAYWAAVAEDGVSAETLASNADANGIRLVDKLPLSIVRLHWFRLLFPDALLLTCVRDPRDLVWSNYLQDSAANPFAAETTDLASTAELVATVLELWLAWREDPPLRTIEVRYEDVTTDPEATMRPVIEAMGLEWEASVTTPHLHSRRRPIRTPSYHDVGKPIHAGAQGRWRKVRSHLEPVLPRLDAVVRRLGYAPTLEPVS